MTKTNFHILRSGFVVQFNPCHDERGRFCSTGGGYSNPKTSEDSDLKNTMSQFASMIGSHSSGDRKYSSPYDMVMKLGKFYEPPEGDLPRGVEKGEVKGCFKNAANLALYNSNYSYVEGFAGAKVAPIPFAHAWCVDRRTGKIVDPTWTKGNNLPPGISYFGIKFNTDFLRKTLLQTKHYGIIPDYPTSRYNPVKTGFPKGAVE